MLPVTSPVCSPPPADTSVPVKRRTDSRRCLCRHPGPRPAWRPTGWRRGWGSCSSCASYSAQRLSYWSTGSAGPERKAEDTSNSSGHSRPPETRKQKGEFECLSYFKLMTHFLSLPDQRGSGRGRGEMCKPSCTRWWTSCHTQSMYKNNKVNINKIPCIYVNTPPGTFGKPLQFRNQNVFSF